MDEIKRIKERYTKVEKHPAFESGYAIILMVGVQSFRLDYFSETMDEAEWMRDMLAKALKTFLEERA